MGKRPVVILSGFLGSGKTTLLSNVLRYAVHRGLRPAVIMNEVGDENLDGQLLDENIPMREMLSGCICCTIRGDLGAEIGRLIRDSSPELIAIEATGVAHPMEVLDGVAEAALLHPVDIQAMITVVDLALFSSLRQKRAGRTYRLMRDQIRCASILFLNKRDRVSDSEFEEALADIKQLNGSAFLFATVRCEVEESVWEEILNKGDTNDTQAFNRPRGEATEEQDEHALAQHSINHSHEHVTAYTHDFTQPIEIGRLEQAASQLPDRVYRAKGIFTDAVSGKRMMFQYAFRQLHVFAIQPKRGIRDVAVFLGEHFPESELKLILEQLDESNRKKDPLYSK